VTPERIKELRALAAAATRGPWQWHCELLGFTSDVGSVAFGCVLDNGGDAGIEISDADAAFVEAANPAAVLELLDEIERAQDLVEDVDVMASNFHADIDHVTSERDEARSDFATLLEAVEATSPRKAAAIFQSHGLLRSISTENAGLHEQVAAREEARAAAVAEAVAMRRDRDTVKAELERACKLIADMHSAAVGEVTGPRLGVVEDVAALRAEVERLRSELNLTNVTLDDRDKSKRAAWEEIERWRAGDGVAVMREALHQSQEALAERNLEVIDLQAVLEDLRKVAAPAAKEVAQLKVEVSQLQGVLIAHGLAEAAAAAPSEEPSFVDCEIIGPVIVTALGPDAVMKRIRIEAAPAQQPEPDYPDQSTRIPRLLAAAPGLLAWCVGCAESEAGSDLVYAATAERAIELAVAHGDCCPELRDQDVELTAERRENADHFASAEGVEKLPEVLRAVGWAMEDDEACDSCGLHSMHDERFEICIECRNCVECGCEGCGEEEG
jgi:hypothetical protein